MTSNSFKTQLVFPKEKLKRTWQLIDAKDQVLGRVANRIADIISGKTKSIWTPMQDVGDYVVVINTALVKITGKKKTQRKHFRHSGYLGNLREETMGDLLARDSNELVRRAVVGMLPNKRISHTMLQRLHLYSASKHPYTDQISKK